MVFVIKNIMTLYYDSGASTQPKHDITQQSSARPIRSFIYIAMAMIKYQSSGAFMLLIAYAHGFVPQRLGAGLGAPFYKSEVTAFHGSNNNKNRKSITRRMAVTTPIGKISNLSHDKFCCIILFFYCHILIS